MAHRELDHLLSARPFVPVELSMSDGRTLLLSHPETFLLTKVALVVRTPDGYAEYISLLHIVSARVREESESTAG